MNVFWFLPTHGDGRYLGTQTGGRSVTLAYLRQIAQAAEDFGQDDDITVLSLVRDFRNIQPPSVIVPALRPA